MDEAASDASGADELPPRIATMETVDRRSTQRGSEKAYETLRQRLVGGHYKPGTQLKEEPLAREFEISRTPVRAALKRLVEDGLATADAGQGHPRRPVERVGHRGDVSAAHAAGALCGQPGCYAGRRRAWWRN